MTRYTLPELGYDYSALEPAISGRIMELHHSKHHQAYVTGANAALDALADARDSGSLSNVNKLQRDLAFNLGGHVNHSIFWTNLTAPNGERAEGELAAALDDAFGSFEKFQAHFTATALGVQGSGWAILAWDTLGQQPIIVQLYDQQGNLPAGIIPLLMLDVWEHAYYLDYQNVRASYVTAFWSIIDWANVTRRFERARDTTAGLITF
ncbi:superoxide dismutase [Leifsonia sp. YAF41]|uniref:superoxide dismutase n=1 Tax=Leifsonia sp. YAF41 TaxID=3233086 RepID=UPI003F964C82